MCGHKEALESIVFYAPLNVSGEKDETNRTAARRFYDNLKKMEKAYPLKWMRK